MFIEFGQCNYKGTNDASFLIVKVYMSDNFYFLWAVKTLLSNYLKTSGFVELGRH